MIHSVGGCDVCLLSGGGSDIITKSCPTLTILWTVAHGVPLSIGFPRQKYWSGSYFLLQGIFPTQGLNPGILYCRQYFYWLRHQGSPITKFHRLINNRNLFLTGLDPRSHRSECQCGHVLMRAVFCADFSLYPHKADSRAKKEALS